MSTLGIVISLTFAIVAFVLMRRAAQPSVKPARTATLDLSPASLQRIFGAENVTSATAYRRIEVAVAGTQKFGGRPDFLTGEHWPRCKQCQLPMTFIGQLDVGPRAPLPYPREGRLFLFLCNSDPTVGEQCETWDHESGASACFVQPGVDAPLPLGEESTSEKDFSTTLSRLYDAEPHVVPSVRLTADAGNEQFEHHAAVAKALTVQAGGFGEWVQSPIEVSCSCGAPTELVLQFDAFDEAINLGDAGRAYVFACRDRHAPDAFFVEWQCT